MSADNNAPGRPYRAACGECTDGVLIGFTYGFADVPDGAVPMQRCDECCRYRGDEDAAVAVARSWGTSWGIAGDPTSETAPGDWWVRLPTASEWHPFLSESAAVQAWIDGTAIPCLGCGKAPRSLGWGLAPPRRPRVCASTPSRPSPGSPMPRRSTRSALCSPRRSGPAPTTSTPSTPS